MKTTLALIGPGRVGCAVSRKLYESGYELTAVIGRDQQRAGDACHFIGCPASRAATQMRAAVTADIILLAVPDDHIAAVAAQFQQHLNPEQNPTLIHFSGLHPAAIMQTHTSTTPLLSLHPLLPFATREAGYNALDRCPCVIEAGDAATRQWGKELVTVLGGLPFTLAAEKKGLYHTAASLSSNYLVTLTAMARDLLLQCGIETEEILPLLLPLLKTTLGNIEKLGTEQGLTGPIVRGDCGTVSIHLKQLADNAPQQFEAYRILALQTVHLGEKSRRLNPAQAEKLKKILGCREPLDKPRTD